MIYKSTCNKVKHTLKRIHIITCIPFLFFVNLTFAQTIISGKFSHMENWSDSLYLQAITDYGNVFANTTWYHVDTTIVTEDGSFEFYLDTLPCTSCIYRIATTPKGQSAPSIYRLSSKDNYVLFELKENQLIHIEANANQLANTFYITSDEEIWNHSEIRKIRAPIYVLYDQMITQMQDPEFMKGLDIDSITKKNFNDLEIALIENNKILIDIIEDSDNIYDKLIGMLEYDYDDIMENDLTLYSKIQKELEDRFQDHPYYAQFSKKVYEAKHVLPPGSTAPNIHLPDPTNTSVKLSDVGENLVLLDFWASWCAPCRRENRLTVKPLYEQYKEQGFQVYSVSMDDKRSAWINALERDQMTWTNVSDLMGLESPLYKTYKIKGLPTTYLIDKKNFTIISKNVRGDELVKFVQDYYNNK